LCSTTRDLAATSARLLIAALPIGCALSLHWALIPEGAWLWRVGDPVRNDDVVRRSDALMRVAVAVAVAVAASRPLASLHWALIPEGVWLWRVGDPVRNDAVVQRAPTR